MWNICNFHALLGEHKPLHPFGKKILQLNICALWATSYIMDKCTGVHQKTCVRASQNTIHSQSPEIAPMSIFSRVTKTVAYSHSRKLLSENEKKLPATSNVWRNVTLRERSQSPKRRQCSHFYEVQKRQDKSSVRNQIESYLCWGSWLKDEPEVALRRGSVVFGVHPVNIHFALRRFGSFLYICYTQRLCLFILTGGCFHWFFNR